MLQFVRMLQVQLFIMMLTMSCTTKMPPSNQALTQKSEQKQIYTSSAELTNATNSTLQTQQKDYGVKAVSTFDEYMKLVGADSSKQLVEIISLIPNIALDIRYATKNNFMQRVMYPAPKAFLAKPAAIALLQIQQKLNAIGYGLKIYDAYRPYSITVDFYERVNDTTFVASAYRGSRHNRGCAVDVSLINLATGKELPMPTEFDDFSSKAHTNYTNLPKHLIKNRETLKQIMLANNFEVYNDEWWHFDYKGWRNHPIMNLPFSLLSHQAVLH